MFKEVDIIAIHNDVYLDNDLNEYQTIHWDLSHFVFYECLQHLKIKTIDVVFFKDENQQFVFLEKIENLAEKFEGNPRFKIVFKDFVNANQWILYHYLTVFFQTTYNVEDFNLNREENNEIIFPILNFEEKSTNKEVKNFQFEQLIKGINPKKLDLLWERFTVLMKNPNFENKIVLSLSFLQTSFQKEIKKNDWVNEFIKNEKRFNQLASHIKKHAYGK